MKWDLWRHPNEKKELNLESWESLLDGVPRVLVDYKANGTSPSLEPNHDAVRDASLDLLVALGAHNCPLNVGDSAKFGLWSLTVGDDRITWPNFASRELTIDAPLTTVRVEVSHSSLGTVTICSAKVPTVLGASFVANAIPAWCSATALMIWSLKELHTFGWSKLVAGAVDSASPKPSARNAGPTARSLVRLIGRSAFQQGQQFIRTENRNFWQLGLRRRRKCAPWSGDWDDFRWIEAERGQQLADGFLFEHKGRTWLFAEALYDRPPANLACAEVYEDGSLGKQHTILKADHHLSFPCVFEHSGEIYMIPESEEAGSTNLFRATDFPYRWKLDHVLFDHGTLDTVSYFAPDGTAYFFTSMRGRPGAHPLPFLFFSSTGIKGKWQRHPACPISLDARYSRNANRLLVEDHELYRIAQDPTIQYGRQMHFMKISRLTRSEYCEELVATRSPGHLGTTFVGTHSYNRTSSWELVDALGRYRHRVRDVSAGMNSTVVRPSVEATKARGKTTAG